MGDDAIAQSMPGHVLVAGVVDAAEVDQLLEDVFMRFDEPRRRRLRIVMTALAYGKGSGLSDERWMAFSTVLGLEGASAHDLLDVRDSPLQSFIVDRVKDGTRLTTYFHRVAAIAICSPEPASIAAEPPNAPACASSSTATHVPTPPRCVTAR